MLALPMGGCFFTPESSAPLLTANTADFPFTRIVVEGDGNTGPQTLVRVGDAYGTVNDPLEGQFTVLLKKLGEGAYVSQTTWKATGKTARLGPRGTVYGIIKLREREFDHLFCWNWSATTLQSAGIAVRKDLGLFPECHFTKLDQLVTLSDKQPDGKWAAVQALRIVSVEK